MKCWFCKRKITTAIRDFVRARNGREKDNFRDVCENCYAKHFPSTATERPAAPVVEDDPQNERSRDD